MNRSCTDNVKEETMDKQEIERPDFVSDEHLEFLDSLRESGVTNMYGATPYLEEAFDDLKRGEATKVLGYWMKTFTQRHPR